MALHNLEVIFNSKLVLKAKPTCVAEFTTPTDGRQHPVVYLQNVMKLNLQLVMTRNLEINFGKSEIVPSTMSFVFVIVVLILLIRAIFK